MGFAEPLLKLGDASEGLSKKSISLFQYALELLGMPLEFLAALLGTQVEFL